jgi:dTDP-4-amino-4,6-dideoxygalactose transaminase
MILMNDFSKDSVQLKSKIVEAITEVIDSGWYVLGKNVESFEREFAKKLGIENSVGVCKGIDAIEIILRSRGIGAGDEVITSAMTAFPSVLAIIRAGAVPVLADIEPGTGIMSINSVKNCVTSKTKAVLLVHLYGQIRQMQSWKQLAKDCDIDLIEDCAQCHLASSEGESAGSFGVAGAYSFYPTKNLGAYGDAGAIATNSEEIKDSARILRDYGQKSKYDHTEIGLNSRLDEVQATILLKRLEILKVQTTRRQDIAKLYFENVNASSIRLLEKPLASENHVFHLFVVLSDRREHFKAHLLQNGIQSNIHYPIPMHQQKALVEFNLGGNDLSFSEQHASECISIPCHPNMTDVEVFKVIETINTFR